MNERIWSVVVPAMMLAACGQAGGDSAAPASPGETAFAQCRSCHGVEPGVNGVGPSLHGVVGRAAGSLAGYGYSAQMRGSSLTWDRATLERYLAAPQDVVPGSRMVWVVVDAAARTAIIDYLETQR
jgi:cytochrome c